MARKRDGSGFMVLSPPSISSTEEALGLVEGAIQETTDLSKLLSTLRGRLKFFDGRIENPEEIEKIQAIVYQIEKKLKEVDSLLYDFDSRDYQICKTISFLALIDDFKKDYPGFSNRFSEIDLFEKYPFEELRMLIAKKLNFKEIPKKWHKWAQKWILRLNESRESDIQEELLYSYLAKNSGELQINALEWALDVSLSTDSAIRKDALSRIVNNVLKRSDTTSNLWFIPSMRGYNLGIIDRIIRELVAIFSNKGYGYGFDDWSKFERVINSIVYFGDFTYLEKLEEIRSFLRKGKKKGGIYPSDSRFGIASYEQHLVFLDKAIKILSRIAKEHQVEDFSGISKKLKELSGLPGSWSFGLKVTDSSGASIEKNQNGFLLLPVSGEFDIKINIAYLNSGSDVGVAERLNNFVYCLNFNVSPSEYLCYQNCLEPKFCLVDKEKPYSHFESHFLDTYKTDIHSMIFFSTGFWFKPHKGNQYLDLGFYFEDKEILDCRYHIVGTEKDQN